MHSQYKLCSYISLQYLIPHSTEKMSDYLTIADLNKVYLATFEARIKWRNILLMLEVSAATIRSISKEWANNPDDCYREGLLEWLKEGERSWKSMVEALSSPTVGHSDIARTVERDHLQSSNPTDVKSEGRYQCLILSLLVSLPHLLSQPCTHNVYSRLPEDR